jgi:hypothetical protein
MISASQQSYTCFQVFVETKIGFVVTQRMIPSEGLWWRYPGTALSLRERRFSFPGYTCVTPALPRSTLHFDAV